MRGCFPIVIPLVASACAASTVVSDPSAPTHGAIDDAAETVENTRLRSLLERHWAYFLEANPVDATQLGVHRFDDRIRIRTPEFLEDERRMRRAFADEAEAIAKDERLSSTDATTTELFLAFQRAEIRNEVCVFETWSLSPQHNPITEWSDLAVVHPVASPKDGENLLSRYRRVATAVDTDIANLRRGVTTGAFANAESARRVVELVKRELAKPSNAWALCDPTKAVLADWPPEVLARFRGEIASVVESIIRPAFARYGAFVEQEILPRARPPDRVGLGPLPF